MLYLIENTDGTMYRYLVMDFTNNKFLEWSPTICRTLKKPWVNRSRFLSDTIEKYLARNTSCHVLTTFTDIETFYDDHPELLI